MATLLDAFRQAAGLTQTMVQTFSQRKKYELDTLLYNQGADIERALSVAAARRPDFQNDPEGYRELLETAIGDWKQSALSRDTSTYYLEGIDRLATQALNTATSDVETLRVTSERDRAAAESISRRANIKDLSDPNAVFNGLIADTEARYALGVINASEAARERVEAADEAFATSIYVPRTIRDSEEYNKIFGQIQAAAEDTRFAETPDRGTRADAALVTLRQNYRDSANAALTADYAAASNLTDPYEILTFLNNSINEKTGAMSETDIVKARIEAANLAYKKRIEVPETITDYHGTKAGIMSAIDDPAFELATSREALAYAAIADLEAKNSDSVRAGIISAVAEAANYATAEDVFRKLDPIITDALETGGISEAQAAAYRNQVVDIAYSKAIRASETTTNYETEKARIREAAADPRFAAAQNRDALANAEIARVEQRENDELEAARITRWAETANLEDPDQIYSILNADIDAMLGKKNMSPSRAAELRIEAAGIAYQKAMAVSDTLTDGPDNEIRAKEAAAADPRYAGVTQREKLKENAIAAIRNKYWNHNFSGYEQQQQLFLNYTRNGQFAEAAAIQGRMAEERDRLVRTLGDGIISREQSEKLDMFYRDSSLERWKNPDMTGENSEIKTMFDIKMSDWRRGGVDATELLRELWANEQFLSATTFTNYVKELLSADDKGFTKTKEYLDTLDAILALGKPKSADATPEAVAAYEQYVKDIMSSFIAARFRGEADLSGYIQGVVNVEASEYLSNVSLMGEIGTRGIVGTGTADNVLRDWTRLANQGDLDIFIGEKITANGPERMNVGNFGALMPQINELGKDKLNGILRDTGVTITGIGQQEAKESGDLTGAFRYKGSDGKTYRLAVNSSNESFYAEVLEDGAWKKVEGPPWIEKTVQSLEKTVQSLGESGQRLLGQNNTPADFLGNLEEARRVQELQRQQRELQTRYLDNAAAQRAANSAGAAPAANLPDLGLSESELERLREFGQRILERGNRR